MRVGVIKLLFIGMTWALSVGFVSAQKYDYTWLTGYDSYAIHDTATSHTFGNTKFDFNQAQVAITLDSLGINFNRCISVISDSIGNVLFYTNGVRVNNGLDELIQNGDSLGWGALYSYFSTYEYESGNANPDILISLPNPKSKNIFDLFYGYIDTSNGGTDLSCKRLLQAKIDIVANNAHSAVIEKDRIVLQRETNWSITALRHANGRDWWICTGITGGNCYEVFLYDGSDTPQWTVQCGGINLLHDHSYCARFSPDGTHYMVASDLGSGSLFDFDRCSGTLTLKEEFGVGTLEGSADIWPAGLEFSPDSRFVYLFCGERTIQLDVQASPVISSIDTVNRYDGFNVPYPSISSYGQLAPDGKIYTCTEGGNYYISVIDNPNGQGANCNFLPHNIQMPSWMIGLPYYPNYRLGALAGSACDTLAGLNEIARADKEKIIKIFPNPAIDNTIVDYGFTDWSKGPVSLQISNELGQIVFEQTLPMYSGYQKIDVSKFAAGLYNAAIVRNNGVVGVGKFVKE